MNLEMKKSKLFLNKIDMKYKYIKLLLQLKINLRNPNIIDVSDDNSHTIYASPNIILNLNGETTNWRLITYKYNNKLSYTYDYNVIYFH